MVGLGSNLWRRVFAMPAVLSAVVVGSPLTARSPQSSIDLARDAPLFGEAFLHNSAFNDGDYGQYVTQKFKTSDVNATKMNMMQPFTSCDDGSYIFVAPRGEIVEQPAAAIYDASGSLVWTTSGDFGQIYNFQVQRYKGEQYLTFWSGDDSLGGHGSGYYYMYDQHYNLVQEISAGNGLGADLHSFTILPDNTALVTVYEKVKLDMTDTPMQPPDTTTWVWDCLFQQVDIETGVVTFQWRASEHFPVEESYTPAGTPTEEKPWDWFHINMVEKDAAGNYLVSARHLRTISYVSGTTGTVLWKLGGKANMFEDLSGGDATLFVGQHDAHWDEDQHYITFFDNRADWQYELEHVSKGRRIKIDVGSMTARVNATYIHPLNIFAFSQGSYQTLPNRNVLIGYGYTGAFTEFSPEGEVLCDAYLQPSSRFSSGDVQSYRNMKFNWTGVPLTEPSFILENGTLSVSWLGSTEVRSWTLQHAYTTDGKFASVISFPKAGFETDYITPEDLQLRRYLRVVAVDHDGGEIKASLLLDIGDEATLLEGDDYDSIQAHGLELGYQRQDAELFMTFGFLLTICLLILLSMIDRRKIVGRCWSRKGSQSFAIPEHVREKDGVWQRLLSMLRGNKHHCFDPASDGLLGRRGENYASNSQHHPS